MERLNDDVRAVYYSDVIEKYLISNKATCKKVGNAYVVQSGKDIIKITMSGTRICIHNTTQNTKEYYLFDAQDLDVIFRHYKFAANEWERTNISFSEVRYTDDHLLLSSKASALDNSRKNSCSNKLLFFSEDYLNQSLESTLSKLSVIDDFRVLGLLSSEGLNIDSEDAVRAVLSEEELLTNDVCREIAR